MKTHIEVFFMKLQRKVQQAFERRLLFVENLGMQKCCQFFVNFWTGEKWFSSLIEHERHPLGVSKLFFGLFINTLWAYFKNFALFES